VRGVLIAVTAVTGTNQCAEIDKITRGRGIRAPMETHAEVYSFFASAFMGFPWPKKIAGMRMTKAYYYWSPELGGRPDSSV